MRDVAVPVSLSSGDRRLTRRARWRAFRGRRIRARQALQSSPPSPVIAPHSARSSSSIRDAIAARRRSGPPPRSVRRIAS
jgi:hypothetical protein